MIRLLSVFSLLAAASAATAQPQLQWSQYSNGYAIVPSSRWSEPMPFDVESADDFEFTGDVQRVIVYGYYDFMALPPGGIDGVWVRFYEGAGGAPGALQHEVFVAEGSPGFVHTPTPTDLDVTLPQAFRAQGRHFVSLQLVTPRAHGWMWWSARNGSAAVTTLGSAHSRDRSAGGAWEVRTTALGHELDLAFEVWGDNGVPPANPTDPCGPWQHLAVPPLPSNHGTTVLRGMTVVALDDVWAVGNPVVEVAFRNYEFKNYALHWDGERWTEVPTPNPSVFPPPYGSTGLQAVDSLAADFVWAVGSFETQDSLGFIIDQPLVLRFDGQKWDQVPVPNTNYDTYTYGVKLLAPDDAWIVGGGVTPCRGGLAIHWDGSRFTVTPTPGTCSGLGGGTPGFDLVAVDGVASDDVWGVGGGSDGDFSGTTYVLHWDGSRWSYVSNTPAPGFARRLFDVHARASDDVWAVGQYEEIVGSVVQYRAFAMHWDGGSWTLHDGATAPIGGGAVHAFAPDDVYTAGGRIYHYDGNAWSVADDFGQVTGVVRAVSVAALDAVAPCHLWAVGRQDVGGQLVPFTARHVGTSHWQTASRRCAAHPGPTGGIAVIDPPKVGTPLSVAIGDPQSETGFTPGATQTMWLLGTTPAPGPCGGLLPGFGLGGGTAALLVDVSVPPVVLTAGVTWNGPTSPGVHTVLVPALAQLAGVTIATQGLLADFGAPSPIVLTDAIDVTLGF